MSNHTHTTTCATRMVVTHPTDGPWREVHSVEYACQPLGIDYSDASAGELAIVDADVFRVHYEAARAASPMVADMTSDWSESNGPDNTYRVSLDGRSGYAVRDGELVFVFSTVKGRGDAMMRKAVADGAYRLDCFDGYLTAFYARHGFRETFRESNWTPGGVDVVWMHR